MVHVKVSTTCGTVINVNIQLLYVMGGASDDYFTDAAPVRVSHELRWQEVYSKRIHLFELTVAMASAMSVGPGYSSGYTWTAWLLVQWAQFRVRQLGVHRL